MNVLEIDREKKEVRIAASADGIEAFRDWVGTRLFGARFTRLDGEPRRMSARFGVRCAFNSPWRGYSANRSGDNMTVFDFNKKGYRSIPLSRLHSVTVKGQTFDVEVLR